MIGKECIGIAHGRVNLIGEHTDYNGGWVLPTTIPQKTRVVVSLREDRTVRAVSNMERNSQTQSYELGAEARTNGWIDYIQGATKILAANGHQLRGFDVSIQSEVPMGSGLSSSAALEVALLKACREALALTLSDLDIARIGQRIENEFVGARVGIMDQMACALARAGEALHLDTRDLLYESLPLPLDKMDLLVINSGISHRLSSNDGGYNQRRAECEEACRLLGVLQLREIEIGGISVIEKLPDVLKRRARHVITENARVAKAVDAIRDRDPQALGRLFLESHASMRDDYEVSIPEIDALVRFCAEHPSTYGARLTGGGFGGSIVAITRPGEAANVARTVVRAYHDAYPEKATVMVPQGAQ